LPKEYELKKEGHIFNHEKVRTEEIILSFDKKWNTTQPSSVFTACLTDEQTQLLTFQWNPDHHPYEVSRYILLSMTSNETGDRSHYFKSTDLFHSGKVKLKTIHRG
jgi:hypothetical protein